MSGIRKEKIRTKVGKRLSNGGYNREIRERQERKENRKELESGGGYPTHTLTRYRKKRRLSGRVGARREKKRS